MTDLDVAYPFAQSGEKVTAASDPNEISNPSLTYTVLNTSTFRFKTTFSL
jgi:hypothetical protein